MIVSRCCWAALIVSLASPSHAGVRINEISNRGTSGTCQGHDWVELRNSGDEDVDLSNGYILHDDHGVDSELAFAFPAGMTILAKDYLLLCCGMESSNTTVGFTLDVPIAPQFGIGGKDIISLVQMKQDQNDATVVQSRSIYKTVSTVSLPNTDDAFDVTYAYNADSKDFAYTSTPTPGKANQFMKVKTQEEKLAEHRQAMKAQNALGTQFFGMDDRGYKVKDAMAEVLELHVTMNEEDYEYMMANKSFELYRPFESAQVTTSDGEETIVNLASPGQIRPKGQSTLFMAACLGTKTMPFQLDFSATNQSQTLFGVQKLYLRHHMGDFSYLRDYAYNRMLAQFGMPHLRVRKVEFFINDVKFGYYSLMEAMDQEYVFARNFPNYDPKSYALYKLKSMSLDCGAYTEAEMENAAARLSETNTPPYAFQRGEQRPIIEELGMFSADECLHDFLDNVWNKDYADVILAYQRYDEDCAAMLLGEGLIERDLGTKDWDKAMEHFITKHFRGDIKCDMGCSNSDLASKMNIENILKMFAFYAVVVDADSPLINGNNFYLAQAGDEAFGGPGGWRIVPYDFNAARVVFCHDNVCNQRLVHWSIVRPTCESLEANNIVGPVLSDPDLHAKYLEYVREFTETVYANKTFIDELVEFQAIQEPYVRDDFWSVFGSFYGKELTPDAANWKEEIDRFPLLATMKARAKDVRFQLAAIDDNRFPRGPHVGVNGDNEAWEYCPDWRTEEANTTMCEKGCKYEGCNIPGWTVESYCDEELGICYHGNYDEQCRGLYDGERYHGMEDTEDGRPTFCRFAEGVPVKAAQCPVVGASRPEQNLRSESSAAATSKLTSLWKLFFVAASCALIFV